MAYFFIGFFDFLDKKWTFKVRTLTSIHDNCRNYFEKSTRSSEWKLRERLSGGQDKPTVVEKSPKNLIFIFFNLFWISCQKKWLWFCGTKVEIFWKWDFLSNFQPLCKPSIFSNRRCIFQVSMHHVHVLVCATSDGNRLNLSIIWIIKVQFIQKLKTKK